MKTSVQARLDEESAAALETLERRLGLSSSEIVRASLRFMLERQPSSNPKKFIGLGEFDSGVADLATNKKYLETLGQYSGLDADPRRKGKAKRVESVA